MCVPNNNFVLIEQQLQDGICLMKTKIIKSSLASLLVAASWLFSGAAVADSITMSAGCPGDTDCDGGVTDVYSFSLVIDGSPGVADPTFFRPRYQPRDH